MENPLKVDLYLGVPIPSIHMSGPTISIHRSIAQVGLMGSGQLGQRQVDFEMPGTGGLGGLDPMQQSMQSGQGSQ